MPPRQQVRQQVLVLYLSSSALDTQVIAWANYDGTGRTRPMSGDESEAPYKTGVHALRDGWRLIQASPLVQHSHGDEFRTGYLKYEFFFERLVEMPLAETTLAEATLAETTLAEATGSTRGEQTP